MAGIKQKRNNLMPKWSDLDGDVLELVLKKLTNFLDILRFKSVCSSWNKAAKSYVSSSSNCCCSQPPLLMLPNQYDPLDDNFRHMFDQILEEGDDDNVDDAPNEYDRRYDSHSRQFYSLAEKKVYEFNNLFQGLDDAHCVGSSHHLFVIIDRDADLFVVSPFSNNIQQRTLIKLPKLTPYPRSKASMISLRRNFIHKAAVIIINSTSSTTTTTSSLFVVVVVYSMSWCLAAYFSGYKTKNKEEEKWIDLPDIEGKEYRDILSHNGKLYALSYISIEVWDFNKVWDLNNYTINEHSLKKIIVSVLPLNLEPDPLRMYLVESMGEILTVSRFKDEFLVFKVDFNGDKKMVPMESLEDRALFLGRNESMSVSTRDFPECESNSIYFVNDYWDDFSFGHDWNELRMDMNDIGVYNLEAKVTNRIDHPHVNILLPSIWIVPNLK